MALQSLAYGVSIQKNADIQHLAEQVQLAQNRVAQQQTIVDSLQGKSTLFANSLAQATNNRATALAGYNTVKELMVGIGSVAGNLDTASRQTIRATEGGAQVAQNMASLVGKLIFTVDVISKVAQSINRQKALNPLLPDSLVAFMANATRDANNAVALTLTALQSCYAAESTLLESRAGVNRAADQARQLEARMNSGWSGAAAVAGKVLPNLNLTANGDGILLLQQQAYQSAVSAYDETLASNDGVAQQLANAQAQLARANMNLASLQAGLKAATAAAYAA